MTVQTSDLGKFLRDDLETMIASADLFNDQLVVGDSTLHHVDASDVDNLIVHLDNGQTFTVRIIAGG